MFFLKKIITGIGLLSIFVFSISFSTYCGINKYGNRYCSYDDGSYEYRNEQGNGNPYDGLPHYYGYTYTYTYTQTPNEKCNTKYPGTIYRQSDGWCACPGDKKGTSSWNRLKNRCPNEDEKCDKKYPGTIYRQSDGRCACPGDKKGTSSWNSSTKSCKKAGEYYITNSSYTNTKNKSKSSESGNGRFRTIVIIISAIRIYKKIKD